MNPQVVEIQPPINPTVRYQPHEFMLITCLNLPNYPRDNHLNSNLDISFKIMLDYSDEEQEVRKRNNSPERSGWRRGVGIGGGFQKTINRLPSVDFPPKPRSLFRDFRERSSGLMMPMRNPPNGDPFIIGGFVPGKPLKLKSELHKFGLNFKGCNLVNEQSGNEDHPDSFFKSMETLVLLAQFFAVLPVSGIRGPNYKGITFKWIHYKTAYWALTFLGTIFGFICAAVKGFEDGMLEAATGILYFACGVMSSLLMLSLSRNWRNLNEEFANVELKLQKYGYPKRIGFKFKVFTIIVLLVALVEHVLGKLKSLKTVIACSPLQYEFYSLAKSFFLSEFSEVFFLFSYGLWKGILALIAYFLVTANWNFKDLFLSFISWTIAERFKQVHDLLDKVQGQDKSVSFWKEVREDFNSVSVLTKRIDNYIRKLMFLSIGNNLIFICIQLFHSIKRKLDMFRLLYFFWSFGFLVLRTGLVAFSAARINDESKEPKTILYSVPQKNYTAEVRRFLTQLTTNEVALTGSGFFSITRSLILTITGSVITYEIVLVQFGDKPDEGLSGNRTMCLHTE